MGGLIGTVSMAKNGLMTKGQNVILYSSESIQANGCVYLCKANTNISFIDVFLTHPYRNAVKASVAISYETGKVSCNKSFVIGSESLAELYYNIASDGCEVYIKNLQNGPMAVTAIVYRGILEAPVSVAELPSSAVKF